MTFPPKYLKVAFNLPVNRLFTYSIPPDLRSQVRPGMRVLAPFGSRQLTGYIVEIKAADEVTKVKDILAILDREPLINPTLLRLTRWVSRYYLCPWGVCLSGALPRGIDIQSQRVVSLTQNGLVGQEAIPGGIKAEILGLLQQAGRLSLAQLKRKLGTKGLLTAVFGLQQEGLVQLEDKLSSPQVKPKTIKYWQLAKSVAQIEQEFSNISRRAPKQAAILSAMLQAGELSAQQLKTAGLSRSSIAPLIKKGLICAIERPILRQAHPETVPQSRPPALLPSQQEVVSLVSCGLDQRKFMPVLLHGITGSGKTEVYLNAIAKTIASGRQAIVLVPEISLTYQLWQRFYSRFGSQVALLHSQLSAGERLDEWYRLKRGEAKIVVGARSAIFAPLDNVGLIVLDEEHDSSYKQDNAPRYHARNTALVRGQLEQAVVILGSATPSLESFYSSQRNDYHLKSLPERIENRPLPQVEIVDMRQRLRDEFLSPQLVQAIKKRLTRKEQVLLFLNRRGYTPFILCRQCGQVVCCPSCSVSLTYHLKGRASCHYCGYSIAPPRICVLCKGEDLQYFGLGTQRLESQLKVMFPKARIARMDRDSTSHKGAHWQIFKKLQAREIDILIGTQMITKGLDLPGITLVGVVAADIGLGIPDFRAAERTFQLLTQVAGRAGRGDIPGEVIIQTFNPEHYSIQAAREHDYHRFYEQEITYRKSLQYPPVMSMINLLLTGKQNQQVGSAARFLAGSLKNYKGVKLLGPAPATIARIKGKYRWQLMLKGAISQGLHTRLENAITNLGQHQSFKGIRVEVDVDPVNLL